MSSFTVRSIRVKGLKFEGSPPPPWHAGRTGRGCEGHTDSRCSEPIKNTEVGCVRFVRIVPFSTHILGSGEKGNLEILN